MCDRHRVNFVFEFVRRISVWFSAYISFKMSIVTRSQAASRLDGARVEEIRHEEDRVASLDCADCQLTISEPGLPESVISMPVVDIATQEKVGDQLSHTSSSGKHMTEQFRPDVEESYMETESLNNEQVPSGTSSYPTIVDFNTLLQAINAANERLAKENKAAIALAAEENKKLLAENNELIRSVEQRLEQQSVELNKKMVQQFTDLDNKINANSTQLQGQIDVVVKEAKQMNTRVSELSASTNELTQKLTAVSEKQNDLGSGHETLKAQLEEVTKAQDSIRNLVEADKTQILKEAEKEKQRHDREIAEYRNFTSSEVASACTELSNKIQELRESLMGSAVPSTQPIPLGHHVTVEGSRARASEPAALGNGNDVTSSTERHGSQTNTFPRDSSCSFPGTLRAYGAQHTEQRMQSMSNVSSQPVISTVLNNAPPPTLSPGDFGHFLAARRFQVFKNDGNKVHPVSWINQFEHSIPPSWPVPNQLQFLCGFLEGEPAMRMRPFVNKCQSVEEFKDIFLQAYWSRLMQKRLKDQMSNCETFYQSRFDTLSSFVNNLIRMNQFLSEPYSAPDLIRLCMGKLPPKLLNFIRTGHCTEDLDLFVDLIEELDTDFNNGKKGERSNAHYTNSQNLGRNSNRSCKEFRNWNQSQSPNQNFHSNNQADNKRDNNHGRNGRPFHGKPYRGNSGWRQSNSQAWKNNQNYQPRNNSNSHQNSDQVVELRSPNPQNNPPESL